jgi:hypothetical protein
MSIKKNKILSEKFVRTKLTQKKYDIYLDKNFYYGEDPFKLPATDDWDPATGSCAMHSLFTIESLGAKVTESIKQYKGYKEVTEDRIDSIMKKLDSGSVIELLHVYRNKDLVETLPRNNVYDSHDFCIVKGGSKYFLSQGFQFFYKHKLRACTGEYVRKMLQDILVYLCDYDNVKKWKDLNLAYYNKYFKADLTVGKMDLLPVDPIKKVNGIVLEYLEIKI